MTDFKAYREDAFKRVNSFDRAFKPEKMWENVKLSDICPCYTCEVMKELSARQYEVQMSGGLQEEIMKPCERCIDKIVWNMDCISKLGWYEDNDERLNNKND